MLENKNNLKAWLYLSPALLLLIVFTFYPLFNAFNLAFLKDFNFLLRTTEGYTLFGNFKFVINSPNFKQAMINTFFIVSFEKVYLYFSLSKTTFIIPCWFVFIVCSVQPSFAIKFKNSSNFLDLSVQPSCGFSTLYSFIIY